MLEALDNKGLKENVVPQVKLEPLVYKVQLESEVPQELLDLGVILVTQALLDQVAQLVLEDNKVLKANQVQEERLVMLEQLDPLDPLDQQVLEENQVHKEILVRLDLMEQ
jgi:hypothetical protein